MKLFLIIFIALLLTSGNNVHGQIMKTINDAELLQAAENKFINKPLKILLKEIGPQIKRVSADPSSNSNYRLGYFIFQFVDANVYDNYRKNNKYPKQITVFVKEPFEWDGAYRYKIENQAWHTEDFKKYGELTIVGIRIFGEDVQN